ncbi:MAG: T9SS type A sorting domain-containing protein [Ginsengibacter sp.]
MRKFTGISLALLFGILLIWKIAPFTKSDKNILAKGRTAYLIKDDNEEQEGDEEDGIYETQKHEFEITRDPALGYVPKERLVNAFENIMAKRQMQRPGDVSALSWTERGPYSDVTGPSNGNTRQGNGVTSGRIRAIWVDLGDVTNHTVWVGGISGGIWKTSNISAAPATWNIVSDNFSNMAVSAICQDPTNVNTMYFGTGEKTFNSDAVKGGGIWKSTDHGATWNFLSSTAAFFNVSKMVVDNAGNVYVSTIGSGNGLMRSKDGGTSWTNIAPSGLSTRITEMELSKSGRMHIVAGYYNTAFANAGYRYTDNPATVMNSTWTSATTPFPNPQYNVDLAVAGNTVYALPSDTTYQTPFVYISTNGGDTWTKTAGNPGSLISSGQAWYCTAIAVDPANDQNVVIGGLDMYRTTNGGTTWTQISNWVGAGLSYVHADQQTAVWNGNQVLVGSDGGIHYSNDGGATFTDRNTGLRLKQFYSIAMHPTNYNYFLAGAQDNGVHQLNSPGLAASVEVTGGDGGFTAIDQDQPQFQFGSFVYNQYRRSIDGGNTWSSVNYSGSIGSFINPYDYDNAGNKIYAAGNPGQFLRWENPQTGNTFTPVNLSQLNGKVSTIHVSPFTTKRVYFGSSSGKIVMVDSADGTTISPTDITGTSMPAYNISCVAIGSNDSNLLATYSNYGISHVWVSTTGGGAGGWANVTGNLPDIPVRWALFYPDNNARAIIATEAGVFETNQLNGTSTVWTQNATLPFVRTDMLKYRGDDGTIAAATHGRGVWTTSIPKTTPYIRFDYASTGSTETTTATAGCRKYTDYTLNLNIELAPTGNATVTLGIDNSSTATEGVDFDITTNGSFTNPSKVIVFPNGSAASHTFTVRIYDDAEVEPTENFIINFTISGNTNAVASPSGKILTYSITDNDQAPDPGGAINLYTVGVPAYYLGDISSGAPFNARLKSMRNIMIYKASELKKAGIQPGTITSIGYNIVKSSIRPYKNLQIKLGSTAVNYIVDGATENNNFSTSLVKALTSYATVNGVNLFTLDTPFVWNGTDNIVIELCYDNGTADTTDNADRTLGYSDGGSATQANLYWQENISCGTPFTVADYFEQGIKPVIQMTVTRAGNPIATSGSDIIYIGGAGTNYFFTGNNIIASLSGASANLGCVSASLIETGNVWQSFGNGMRSQKLFDLEPTTNPTASYTIGLYYSTAELGGNIPTTLRIAKTTAASIADADGSNTEIDTTLSTGYRDGYLFTTQTTGFGKFFLVDASVAFPATFLTFTGAISGNNIQLTWVTSSERNAKYFMVQKSTDGNIFQTIGKVNASGNTITQMSYSFLDTHPFELNYYRLNVVDAQERSVPSNTIIVEFPNIKQRLWIGMNPIHDQLNVYLAKIPTQPIVLELIAMNGAKVLRKEYGKSNIINLDLSKNKLSAGIYVLKAMVDGTMYTQRVVKE